MKIGVISDTHDHLENIDRSFEMLRDHGVEMVCHLGDWVAPYAVDQVVRHTKEMNVPLKGVLGNNDGEVFMIVSENDKAWDMELGKQTLQLTIDDRKLILYHGTDEVLTAGLVQAGQFDAVLSGHTHVPRNEMVGATLALNPGTLSGFSGRRGGRLSQGELAVYDSATNTAELLTFEL